MELIIKDSCLLCDKKFNWNELVYGKLPENVWFCQNCFTKFKDDTVYTGKECWMLTEYEPGIIFEYKD